MVQRCCSFPHLSSWHLRTRSRGGGPLSLVLSSVIPFMHDNDISYRDRTGWRAKGRLQRITIARAAFGNRSKVCRHSLHRLNASSIEQTKISLVPKHPDLLEALHHYTLSSCPLSRILSISLSSRTIRRPNVPNPLLCPSRSASTRKIRGFSRSGGPPPQLLTATNNQ